MLIFPLWIRTSFHTNISPIPLPVIFALMALLPLKCNLNNFFCSLAGIPMPVSVISRLQLSLSWRVIMCTSPWAGVYMGHRTKRFFQWSGKMGERLWEPKGLGVVWKMGWIFRSGFFLYMGLHLLYVWGAFLRISGRLLYIGLADGAKTAWKGFVFGCVAVLWLGWWILLCDGVNGCVAVFLCLFSNMMTWNYSK